MRMTFGILMVGMMTSCTPPAEKEKTVANTTPVKVEAQEGESVATFASGCFWCVEEIYESLLGVREVVSGYAGGKAEDANYQAVSSGRTQHAETVQIYYDTTVISFEQLVAAFFDGHDPTTMNQQGPDTGPQYRSIAFYRNDIEKAIIENEIARINQSGMYSDPVVTEVLPFTAFYPAEEYHQDYVEQHPDEPYVRGVSKPRFEKFKEKNKAKLKN